VDIGRGEYASVSGPSRCGESTFLSILALLESPSSGRYWAERPRDDALSPGDKARVRNVEIGLIFQSFNLSADVSVGRTWSIRSASGTSARRTARGAWKRRSIAWAWSLPFSLLLC